MLGTLVLWEVSKFRWRLLSCISPEPVFWHGWPSGTIVTWRVLGWRETMKSKQSSQHPNPWKYLKAGREGREWVDASLDGVSWECEKEVVFILCGEKDEDYRKHFFSPAVSTHIGSSIVDRPLRDRTVVESRYHGHGWKGSLAARPKVIQVCCKFLLIWI